jgi:hypothetical protein
LTAYTRNATGNWTDQAKWTPNGLPVTGDTIDTATFDVTVDDAEVIKDFTAAATGKLIIAAGGQLTFEGAGGIAATGEIDITGTLIGAVGNTGVHIDGTWTTHSGAELIGFILQVDSAQTISGLFNDCSAANQATCRIGMYPAGDLTFDQDLSLLTLSMTYGLSTWNAGVTLKMADYSGNYVTLNSPGIVVVNGTPTSPVTWRSVNNPPTYPVRIWGAAPGSTFTNLVLQNAKVSLGSYADYFVFNRHPQKTKPLNRVPSIDSDICLGREAGRVHWRGSEAGIVEIEGFWLISDLQWALVDKWKAAGTAIAFYSEYVQLPYCRILDHDTDFKSGSLYAPYTITLTEDV